MDGTAVMRLGDPQQDRPKFFEKAVGEPKIPVRIGEVTVDIGKSICSSNEY